MQDAPPPAGIAVRLLRLDPDLAIPAYARPGDAGIDLLATAAHEIAPGGGRALVATGVAMAIPPGLAGFVLPRSGLAARHGVTVVNAPGLIDSGYRGEIMVVLLNTDPVASYCVSRGDRVAQLVVSRVEHVAWELVDELVDRPGDERPADDSEGVVGSSGRGAGGVRGVRGAGGFGHTGR